MANKKETITLIALDTKKERVFDKEHALRILKHDAKKARGRAHKKTWRQVPESKPENTTSSESGNTGQRDNNKSTGEAKESRNNSESKAS